MECIERNVEHARDETNTAAGELKLASAYHHEASRKKLIGFVAIIVILIVGIIIYVAIDLTEEKVKAIEGKQ